MTTRDDIEKGPRFEARSPGSMGDGRIYPRECAACCGPCIDGIDKETGLCRACWRAWRFTLRSRADDMLDLLRRLVDPNDNHEYTRIAALLLLRDIDREEGDARLYDSEPLKTPPGPFVPAREEPVPPDAMTPGTR